MVQSVSVCLFSAHTLDLCSVVHNCASERAHFKIIDVQCSASSRRDALHRDALWLTVNKIGVG